MQKKNNILDWYHLGFSDPETVLLGLDEIEVLAKRDPEEFQNLINLFNSVNSVYRKLLLSEILITLNYLPVKDFYIALINDTENELATEEYGDEWTHTHDKIWAAGRLLFMCDERGMPQWWEQNTA